MLRMQNSHCLNIKFVIDHAIYVALLSVCKVYLNSLKKTWADSLPVFEEQLDFPCFHWIKETFWTVSVSFCNCYPLWDESLYLFLVVSLTLHSFEMVEKNVFLYRIMWLTVHLRYTIAENKHLNTPWFIVSTTLLTLLLFTTLQSRRQTRRRSPITAAHVSENMLSKVEFSSCWQCSRLENISNI